LILTTAPSSKNKSTAMANDDYTIPVEPLGGLDRRFCEVMDAAPVMIWVSGEDKLCNWFNRPWLTFTGRTMAQELGNGWAEGVHPDDYDRCLQIYISHFDARKEFRMQYRLRHRDGEHRWIDDIGVPRYARDGRFLGYIGSCIDIHSHRATEEELRKLKERLEQSLFAERAESAQRLQEALSAGSVVAFEWDVRTDTTRRSDNAPQVLGFDQGQLPDGASFLARINAGDRTRYMAALSGLRRDNSSYSTSYRFTRSDGREIWLEDTAKAEFDAAGRLARVSGLGVDVTARKQAEIRQGTLIAELDHRVKNNLACIAAMAQYTRQGSRSMDELVRSLDDRIQSMADSHSLLSQSRWHGVGLADLARRQLAPYTTKTNTVINGPDITLSATATQAVGMVLHELVTNAVKYGALSIPHGRVSVSWDYRPQDAAGRLAIAWRETGGPPAEVPSNGSYGTNLIRGLIPRELGGTVDLAFQPEGVRCDIEIPIRRGMHN
jgi:PAS domain S-box-containing protein